jgi:hypothetical protein
MSNKCVCGRDIATVNEISTGACAAAKSGTAINNMGNNAAAQSTGRLCMNLVHLVHLVILSTNVTISALG